MHLSALAALAALSLSASAQSPVISEFLASNDDGIVDSDGDSSDWIEIHNPTGGTINLSNWHLTDDPADPLKWTLPSLNFPSGGYMIIPGITGTINRGSRVPGMLPRHPISLTPPPPRFLVPQNDPKATPE